MPARSPPQAAFGRRRHRRASSVGVCSPASRRLAALGPRSAGLPALTLAPRTLVQMALNDDARSYAPSQRHPSGRPLNASVRSGPRRRRLDDAGRVPLSAFEATSRYRRRRNEGCTAIPVPSRSRFVWSTAVYCRKAFLVSSLQDLRATLHHHRPWPSNGLGNQDRDGPPNRVHVDLRRLGEPQTRR